MSGPAPSFAAFRALDHALHTAPDAQLMRVVGVIDDLDDRQEAERLMAPIRARLRPLRPDRPLRIDRLLVTPLESILANAADWRSSAVTLPRSAIKPLRLVIAAAQPELVEQVCGLIAGATTRDLACIAAVGAELWSCAGRVLAEAVEPPEEWAQAGLPAASFAALARGVGCCLAATARVTALADPTMTPDQRNQEVGVMLRDVARAGPTAWGLMLGWLLCGLPQAQAPRDAATCQYSGSAFRGAADAALEHLFAWIESAVTSMSSDVAEAICELRPRALALDAIAGVRQHRSRATTLQSALHAGYTRYLALALRERLLAPLAALDAAATDAAILLLEREARGLRRMAGEIRRLGGPPQSDLVLRDAARTIAGNTALPAMDRARLVEVLHDAETAQRVLALP